VHRAALASTRSGRLAEQLRHHLVRAYALRQAVAVAAVRGRDIVVRLDGRTDAGSDGLLADVQVPCPDELALAN